MAATVLLKLAALTGESRYSDAAERTLAQVTSYAHRYPTAFAQWLSALAFNLSEPVEIAISGPAEPSKRRLCWQLCAQSSDRSRLPQWVAIRAPFRC